MTDKWKKWIPVMSILPFFIGATGYAMAGEKWTDSLYASFALYFVSPVSDRYNALIEIARWTAALVTTTIILFAVRTIWFNMVCWFKCLSGESVAVYCDSDIKILFDKKISSIYPGRKLKRTAKSHIIMLKTDIESLQFYRENREELKGKSVYIGLREIEYGLIKENPEVVFYDMNGTIARVLWKTIGIWKWKKTNFKIAVYGDNVLAENILNYGLLLNLYSENQHISYNLIANNSHYKVKHRGMVTGNGDRLSYYLPDEDAAWNVIENADIVIISEEPSAELLQTIAAVCRKGQIYYYSPTAENIGNYLQCKNINSFGRNEDIFTDENIRQGRLINTAKKWNLKYAETYHGETDWNKLNGFLKWSNISSADFQEVVKDLIQLNINTDIESLAELEHIRWCRFHYINYWKYGIPDNGERKDENKRIHICLKNYSELSQEDKEKDREIIKNVGDL